MSKILQTKSSKILQSLIEKVFQGSIIGLDKKFDVDSYLRYIWMVHLYIMQINTNKHLIKIIIQKKC